MSFKSQYATVFHSFQDTATCVIAWNFLLKTAAKLLQMETRDTFT